MFSSIGFIRNPLPSLSSGVELSLQWSHMVNKTRLKRSLKKEEEDSTSVHKQGNWAQGITDFKLEYWGELTSFVTLDNLLSLFKSQFTFL